MRFQETDAAATNPCPRTWESLAETGDSATRYCDTCRNQVRDLRTLTRREAIDQLASNTEGRRTCLYVNFDADGAPITSEDVGPTRRSWVLGLLARLAAAAMAIAAWSGCGKSQPDAVEAPPGANTSRPDSTVSSSEPSQPHAHEGAPITMERRDVPSTSPFLSPLKFDPNAPDAEAERRRIEALLEELQALGYVAGGGR